MAIKLVEIKDGKEATGLSERINSGLSTILDASNKSVDGINTYFEKMYIDEVNKDSKVNGTIDKLIKAIKKGLVTAMKTINENKTGTYVLYTTSMKTSTGDVPCLIACSSSAPMVTKSVDHTSIRTSGLGLVAVFDNKTRSPLRVEHNGISYPIILAGKEVEKTLASNKQLEEDLKHEIGYIKDNLATKNTFTGYANLTKLAEMFYTQEKKINTEMKCTELNKELANKWKNKTTDDIVTLSMGAINLIGINTLGEAKKLGAIIKKDPNKELRIKVLKKIFGQN